MTQSQEITVRLRVPELFDERGLTPYAVAKASGGRISRSNAYRITQRLGALESFDAVLLEALCDVLEVEVGELFERARASHARAPRRASRTRTRRVSGGAQTR